MSKPSNSERPPKRALIVVSENEPTENQPADKTARREEESLADELLAFHQKVAKLEKDKKGAIRIAAEAKTRVEFLENLVDEKRVVLTQIAANRNDEAVKELQEKIAELTRKQAESDEKNLEEMEELQKNVSDLKEQLAEVVHRRIQDRKKINELTRKQAESDEKNKEQTEGLQKKIEELSKDRDEMTRKLAEAGSNEKKQQKEHQKKIDEMTRKLVHQQHPSSKEANKTASDPSTGASSAARVGGSDRSMNIFDVHYTKGPDSILHRDAHITLRTIARLTRASHGDEKEEWLLRLKEAFKGEKLECTICEKTKKNEKIPIHFWSMHHGRKVDDGSGTAYLSRLAFECFMRKLESVTKKPTVAAVDDVDEEDEKEEENDDVDDEGKEEDDDDEEMVEKGEEDDEE